MPANRPSRIISCACGIRAYVCHALPCCCLMLKQSCVHSTVVGFCALSCADCTAANVSSALSCAFLMLHAEPLMMPSCTFAWRSLKPWKQLLGILRQGQRLPALPCPCLHPLDGTLAGTAASPSLRTYLAPGMPPLLGLSAGPLLLFASLGCLCSVSDVCLDLCSLH